MIATVDSTLLEDLTRTAAADGIAKTVVGAVITSGDGRVLLLRREAGDFLEGLWELPSGGVDPGESLVGALKREVVEETGLDVTSVDGYLGHFDYQSKSGKRTRQFNFTAAVAEGDVQLTEHDAHEWADRSGQERVSSAVQGVLATWRAAVSLG